ncbi:MAG: exosortase/archaeosortase family protein [Phycisphaeraceae bacterium]
MTVAGAGGRWTPSRWVTLGVLVAFAVLATFDAWKDIALLAIHSEESSHILLVPIVAAWLAFVRLDALKNCRPRGTLVGPAAIAVGAMLFLLGYEHSIQSFWHFGAVLIVAGATVTALGVEVVRATWPAWLILALLVPIPGRIRHEIALPMQEWTATATEITAQILGMDLTRQGNVLVINGQSVGIAEACNGMRMVFALLVAIYTFLFLNPMPMWVRALILLAAPLLAIAANVVRLVPTVALYGYASTEVADLFHDVSGWVMVFVAFIGLFGCLRLTMWVLSDDDADDHATPTAPSPPPREATPTRPAEAQA